MSTDAAPANRRYAAVVVGRDREQLRQLQSALRRLVSGPIEVASASSAVEARSRIAELVEAGVRIPLVFVEDELEDTTGPVFLVELQEDPVLESSRKVLLTRRPSLRDVDVALRRGALHGMVTEPWTEDGLSRQVHSHLARWFVDNDAGMLEAVADIVSESAVERAMRSSEEFRRTEELEPGSGSPHFLLDDLGNEDTLHDVLVRAIDRALGHPPRLVLAAGVVLIEEDEDVGGVYVILEGTVQLTHRSEIGDLVVHDQSFGGIVGLLSLAQRRQAFLTCRTVTQVRAIPLTLHQLSLAFAREPSLAALLTRTLVDSLADRLRDSGELQIEIAELKARVERERDQLAVALDDLAAAQARLLESERMATLGELSAGIAHELNNPVAAVSRSADQLGNDVAELIDELHEPALRRVFTSARSGADARSTADHRRIRRELTEASGDRRLAERLLAAGIETVGDATSFLEQARANDDLDRRLSDLARLQRVGRSVRNVEAASGRIASLVSSLRAYVRGVPSDDDQGEPVDVVQVVEDTLALMAHRLSGIAIEREYQDRPIVSADAGGLQQVFTNLVANAVEAMDGSGRLQMGVGVSDGAVVVSVSDNGPGIPQGSEERLFEPRFTTKDGRVSYGLGLGLSISRQLVERQGGSISVVSEPGSTVFTVRLPQSLAGPDSDPSKGSSNA